eukprot:112231_1
MDCALLFFILVFTWPAKSISFTSRVVEISTHSPTGKRNRMAATKNDEIEKAPSDMMPIEASGVIFDIDGTLADSWKLGFDATQVVLEKRNIPLITEASYHECTRYCTPERMA